MIFHPQVGQAVVVHYARRSAMPPQDRSGVVRVVSRGPDPCNVGVWIAGRVVVIPRGNLRSVECGS